MNEAFEKWWKEQPAKIGVPPYYWARDAWQAAEAKLHEPMECGHPRGNARPHLILGSNPDDGQLTTYCLTCEAVAKAEGKAMCDFAAHLTEHQGKCDCAGHQAIAIAEAVAKARENERVECAKELERVRDAAVVAEIRRLRGAK